MTRTRIAIILTGAGAGLAAGALVAVAAIELGGAGHGWDSPSPSVTALFAFPFLGAAMPLPRPIRRGFLRAALAAPLAADVAMGMDAWREAAASFHRMRDQAPHAVILRAVLWFGWQAAGLGAQITHRRTRRRGKSADRPGVWGGRDGRRPTSPLPPGEGGPKGRVRVVGFTEIAQVSRILAPTCPPRCDDPHPPLRGCPLPPGEGTVSPPRLEFRKEVHTAAPNSGTARKSES